jgi:hypothetical protein
MRVQCARSVRSLASRVARAASAHSMIRRGVGVEHEPDKLRVPAVHGCAHLRSLLTDAASTGHCLTLGSITRCHLLELSGPADRSLLLEELEELFLASATREV